jgi:prolyl oligopeptidase
MLVVPGSNSAIAAKPAAPPRAPSQPATDTYHGTEVTDPYRNLENLKSPATRAWLKAQGAYAEAQLAGIPGRAAMVARVSALAQTSGDAVAGVVRMPGERFYYLKRQRGEGQFKLFMKAGADGVERVLVDPQKLAAGSGVPHAINYFVPSWDGRYVAFGASAGGSENASLYVLEVAGGKRVGEPIPRVHEELVHWTPDSSALTYNQVRALPRGAADTETYLDTTVFLLKPGQRAAQARPLFGPLVNPALKLDRLDVAQVFFSADSQTMVARTTDTTVPEGRLFVAPVAALEGLTATNGASIPWRAVSTAADQITDAQLKGDKLYLRSVASAPRGKLLALDAAQPVLSEAKVVVAEPPTGVLEAFALGQSEVYTQQREGFKIRVLRHTADGGSSDVAPSEAGNVLLGFEGASGPFDSSTGPAGLLVQVNTWTRPSAWLIAGKEGSSTALRLREAQVPEGLPEIVVTEVMAPSPDGVQVPIVILHRKGLLLNGANPTLLVGYGAYGFSFDAGFNPREFAWLERGGVLAFANVRGSGAYGEAWHRAGFKATKPNTWKDGIASARYLINMGYTSPAKLGVWGTSAGGIFVGRAVTEAPDLFAAAIFDVGMMDTVRSEESANGITNISEFGSTKNPAEFAALLEMSTYHHVKPGTAYPAVLFIHGLNDPRVDVWHSAKTAARLQAATTSGKPILLRLDAQAGHGMGSTAAQRNSKEADIYSFLLWQFGNLEAPARR